MLKNKFYFMPSGSMEKGNHIGCRVWYILSLQKFARTPDQTETFPEMIWTHESLGKMNRGCHFDVYGYPETRPLLARIFPRRKSGEKSRARTQPIVLSRQAFEPLFDRPLREAAIPPTLRLNLMRMPWYPKPRAHACV